MFGLMTKYIFGVGSFPSITVTYVASQLVLMSRRSYLENKERPFIILSKGIRSLVKGETRSRHEIRDDVYTTKSTHDTQTCSL